MRQNQRNEQQASEQTIKLLESKGKHPMSADDEQTIELGRLIRKSTDVDLPETNPQLRELLREQLEQLGDGKTVLPRKASIDNPDHVTRKWALAIILLLAVGLWATLQMNWPVQNNESAVATGLKYQSEQNASLANEALDQTDLQSSPAANVQPEPENQITNHGATTYRKLVDGYAFDGGNLANKESSQQKFENSETVSEDGQQATILSSNLGTATPGAQTWYVEPSSTIYVPDGGTVLLGGVKRIAESEVPSDYVAKAPPTPQQGQPIASNRFALSPGADDSKKLQALKFLAQTANGPTNNSFLEGRGGGGFGGGGGGFTGQVQGALFGQNPLYKAQPNSEQYTPIHENKFTATVGGDAVSTFSIDVDTASYANMRRFINSGQMPPRDSIRIEELINYFSYDYPQPTGDDPFSVNMEFATCPWNSSHKLLRIGLKGKDVHAEERPATNLVFLIDVSGSMTSEDKLPLLKRGFQMMVNKLTENDRVSIVTYAGNAGVALEPTSGDQTIKINEAIERLTPGGSTHGSAGIELAYKLAQQHLIKDGINKVILATDGDLNVGVTDDDSLVRLIKNKASEGVFLTVLGFGTGNLKDGKLEKLADNGNGLYAYIDSIREAHKVLVEQMSGSLVTIAKDVKIQIEFNPAEVEAYRLIGYENRMLATQDFDNDQKDAGEIGAGHTVTALYELVTTDQQDEFMSAPKGMKYQSDDVKKVAQKSDVKVNLSAAASSGELLTLALRYKKPNENTSKRTEFTIKNDEKSFSSASADFRFAASVASFGMLLRGSQNAGDSNPAMIQEIASAAIGDDKSGYRAEFIDLVRKAGVLCN